METAPPTPPPTGGLSTLQPTATVTVTAVPSDLPAETQQFHSGVLLGLVLLLVVAGVVLVRNLW